MIAFHAMGTYSEYSLRVVVRSENPMKARDAFRRSRIAIFGSPNSDQMNG